jgi:uncharacterized protein
VRGAAAGALAGHSGAFFCGWKLFQGETNMTVAMHQISVALFCRHLNGIAGCLKKAQALYAEKKFDESTLISYRLFPDMFNFARQVQIATDHAGKCVALLAGQEAPAHADDEKSLAELIARVEKTVAWLNSIKPEQINGTEEKSVTLKRGGQDVVFKGIDLVLNRSLPNFYFHVTTAYDILRHNGVEIGKKDFMGA